MFWYVSNEQDQIVMKKPLLENTTILPWETAGCMLGYIRGACASASLKLDLAECYGANLHDIRGACASASLKLGDDRNLCPLPKISEAHAPRPH